MQYENCWRKFRFISTLKGLACKHQYLIIYITNNDLQPIQLQYK